MNRLQPWQFGIWSSGNLLRALQRLGHYKAAATGMRFDGFVQ